MQADQARRWSSTASDIKAILSAVVSEAEVNSSEPGSTAISVLKDQQLNSVQSRAGSVARPQAARATLSQSSGRGPPGHSPPSRAGDTSFQAAQKEIGLDDQEDQ